ncbi:thiamine/thiamine pyrophosphate ABC transporter permease [Pseudohoeflea coraliihabitans]|uniref:Thiamine/thiamine pyrophosphate ABC transporter permease n=1 Tax=Pseudohoeflea coraliihabitans TaxID=2860393 RepID=A0ABS6WKV8_9HYPH|nr:thiamine/thiamine pyrophosphate ABC transporter permease [Pseudohoeflea sp. DP4N28-3]MBW3096574.1 thiamine/thiamine pyrophosphate ABC transporter permease [Pseudohoeflea sp. DP4N28-3]
MSSLLTRAESRAAVLGGVIAIAAISVAIAVPVTALLWRGTTGEAPDLGFDSYLLRVTRFTLLQAVLSTLLSVALAIPLARALARRPSFPGRVWLLRLFAVPLGLPPLVAALGLLTIWGRQGAVNDLLTGLTGGEPFSIYGLSGILLAHVFFNLPLTARLLLLGLERLPQEYWKNAAILGLGQWTTFRHVEWPAMLQPALAAASLVFMLCITSFTLVLVLGGGPAATTLEVAVYQALRFDFDPSRAVFLAVIQIALTIAALALLRLTGGRDDVSELMVTGQARPDVHGRAAGLVDMTVILVAALFVLSPLLATLVAGLSADLPRLLTEAALWRAGLTSLGVALCAALLSLLLALLLIRARLQMPGLGAQRTKHGLDALAGAAGSLVLMVPPIVLGAGWFLLFRGARGSILLPLILIIIINAMMALPFVMRVLEGAYRTAMSRNGQLALALGVTGLSRIRRIDLPALARPLGAAFAFAMALSLGDLGAIALFGNDRLVTLPYLLLQKMGSYRTADAAGMALILATLCIGLMMLADRSVSRQRSGTQKNPQKNKGRMP